MNIEERKKALAERIYDITDEETLRMLEENIALYESGKDVIDDLSPEQIADLMRLTGEPDDKDVLSKDEFKKLFERWSTK